MPPKGMGDFVVLIRLAVVHIMVEVRSEYLFSLDWCSGLNMCSFYEQEADDAGQSTISQICME